MQQSQAAQADWSMSSGKKVRRSRRRRRRQRLASRLRTRPVRPFACSFDELQPPYHRRPSNKMASSPITCHVLDSSLGRPGAGVQVKLEQLANDGSQALQQLATG